MTNKTRKFLHITAYLGTALFFYNGTAHAGFEWSPAPAPEKVMSAPKALPPAHGSSPDMGIVQPMMSMSAPAPVPDVMPAEPMDAAAVSAPAVAPVATVSPVDGVKIPPAPKPAMVYPEIQGFGSDIPLATAMSQIVPADFAYSMDDNTKLGKLVSWSGGVPWNEALQNAVKPLGLVVQIVDKTVWLRDKASMPKSVSVKKGPPAFMTEQKVKETAPVPVDPMMVMPAAADVAPLSPPSMKNKDPMAKGGSNYDNGYDAYPRRRNPVDMMMKADAHGNQTTQASAAPETLKVAAVPMAPDSMAPVPYPETSQLMSDSVAVPAPPAPAMSGFEPMADTPPAPEMAAAKSMDPFEVRYWQAERGASLRDVLTKWGGDAGTRIYWNSQFDYRLPTSIQTHATFPDAVTKILTAYENMEPRPLGRLHPNLPDGPAVLVIENYGALEK